MNRARLEEKLSALPLYQYAFIKTDELTFTSRVRHVCETECPMYGKTWACPPAVGTVEACEARCRNYPEALLIATITEVNDITDMAETLATRAPHEAITRQVHEMVKEESTDTMVLSTEACSHCEKCTYPDAPCRFPDKMYPCVESHGILVTALAENHDISFLAEGNLVTWFSLIFYK